jgi:hypothetical protein
MNFRKVNNITGWIVCIIACTTYAITREPTASFWDCGEFIACANELGIPHPPGSPLFTMMGRLFIFIFSGGNDANVASSVNLLSAMASGFTVLFLFWTITHFAKKMFIKAGENLTGTQLFTTMASGVVGALAYTFSDTAWYNAVEGEVYALSSFFTALLIWSMLKWEHADELAQSAVEKNRADRWIVFIFFMLGLSITVHLLNLLTLPAIVMIYYFRRYTPGVKSGILTFLIGCGITGLVLGIFVYLLPRWSAAFDRMFVNGLELPFFSGFAFFFVLLGILCWIGLRWADKKGHSKLRLGIWCFIFLLVGYSTYVTTLIRSNANPGIDMSNVDNPMSLASYFGREQYGSAPLFYGPHFLADVKRDDAGYPVVKEGRMKYAKGEKKYIELGPQREYEYESKDKMFLPRVWQSSNDQGNVDTYVDWLKLAVNATEVCQIQNVIPGVGIETVNQQGQTNYYEMTGNHIPVVQKGQVVGPGEQLALKKPSFGDNIEWLFSYQLSHMYWRYFMWNFAGRQNDVQGMSNKDDGNWISGIPFMDNPRLGNQNDLPEGLGHTKATNKLFMLPFFLGIFGCVYHFLRRRNDWLVTFLMFFFTGLAIMLYLNMPGPQPRERDYAFVGSYYSFAIWIGLGVVSLFKLVNDEKKIFINTLIYGSALSFFIIVLGTVSGTKSGMIMSSLIGAALFAVFTAAAYYIVKGISAGGKNEKSLSFASAGLCLIIPVLMLQQEWNDHDRSRKTLARDNARNYLESCAPNAILFCFGDNDTYPLWYAQEVEGIRKDIRVINTSLLGIDWYINQLRYKINKSDSVDLLLSPGQIQGDNRAYLRYTPNASISKEKFWDLKDVMKTVLGVGENVEAFPVKRFKVPVDTALVRKNGTANVTDIVYNEMQFELPESKNDLRRDELVILNIIASNEWRRPVYFTSPYGNLGFGQYLRKDGMAYRLVPVRMNGAEGKWVVHNNLRQVRMGGTTIRDNNLDFMYKAVMEHFKTGNAQTKGVYFDEENRRHLLIVKSTFAELAGNLADGGRKDDAKKVLERCESLINTANMPYAQASRYNGYNQTSLIYLEACYKAGMAELAEKNRLAIKKNLDQLKSYYLNLKNESDNLYNLVLQEEDVNNRLLTVYDAIIAQYAPDKVQKPAPAPVNPAMQIPGTVKDSVKADSASKDTGK